MGLATRFGLLILLALVPALGVALWLEHGAREQRTARVQGEALRLAGFAAGELEAWVRGTEGLLRSMAQLPAVRERDAAGCSAHAAATIAAFPHLVTIAAADAAGERFCRHGSAAVTLRSFAGRPWFEAALAAGGRLHVGLLTRSDASGRWALPVALAFPDGLGNPRAGVVVALLDLGRVRDALARNPLPAGGSLTVADRAGTIAVRIPPPPETGGAMRPETRWMLGAPAPGSVAGTGPDGVERIVGYVPPPADGGLLVTVGLDRATALGPPGRGAPATLGLILGSVALALAAAFAGGRLLVARPMNRLLAAARRWHAGDYAARAVGPGLGRAPEFERLARELDAVAEAAAGREGELRAGERRLAAALASGRLAPWSYDVARGEGGFSPEGAALLGLAMPDGAQARAGWLPSVHPDDREELRAAFRAAVAGEAPRFDGECRFRRTDGGWAWLESHGLPVRDPQTGAITAIVGMALDISDRKAAEARQGLLLAELNHRVKNTLVIVQSIAARTARDAPTPEAFREAFDARLRALARTHDLLTAGAWEDTSLRELLERELAPYAAGPPGAVADPAGPGRAALDGPAVRLPATMVVPLGLTFHELATNAAKHGAWSGPAGAVRVAWRVERPADGPPDAAGGGGDAAAAERAPTVLRLDWRESGGPPAAPPAREGFGSRLVADTVTRQLGGRLELDHAPDGLRCRLEIPLPAAA